jgi:hypothetical protein
MRVSPRQTSSNDGNPHRKAAQENAKVSAISFQLKASIPATEAAHSGEGRSFSEPGVSLGDF